MAGNKKGKSQTLEWNIAKERVKKIAQVLSKLRDAYEQARHERRRREVKAYYTYLNSLFQELYIYLPEKIETEDDDVEKWGAKKIQEELDSLEKVMVRGGNSRIPLKHFQKLEKIDRQLNKRRKEMNLDIPVSKETPTGTEFFS